MVSWLGKDEQDFGDFGDLGSDFYDFGGDFGDLGDLGSILVVVWAYPHHLILAHFRPSGPKN